MGKARCFGCGVDLSVNKVKCTECDSLKSQIMEPVRNPAMWSMAMDLSNQVMV
ncbi:hypothetical protein KKB44_03580 [Candidatus Micrarchaeota archaeon]|nr:hypothetical protein [Candidatus Micrarchaeota archaeon]